MPTQTAAKRGSHRPDDATREPQRRIAPRHFALLALVITLAVVPLLRPIMPSFNYVIQVMLVTLMWVAMASSWNILGGFAGYISLGHNVFFAIGGYLSGVLLVYVGLSPFATALLAGVAAVAIGFVIGLITLRARGPAFIISTIALLLMTRLVFDNWEFIGASNGLSLPIPAFAQTVGKIPFYYGMLAAALGAVGLAHWIRSSKFGLGLRAIAQDEVKAEVAGINTRMYKVLAFAMSGFFIAVVGSLWAYSLSYLRPSAFLTIAIAAEMVLMTIIGGKGTVAGPVVGAVLLVLLNEFSVARFGSSELNLVVTGLLMIIVLLFFPLGIVGTLQSRLKDRRARQRSVATATVDLPE